jgi:hypothetical protein
MDTSVHSSVGRIVNISLVARQQMFLILGGVQLIAGILLFGIWKLKQTPQDESREAEATDRLVRDATGRAKVGVDGLLDRLKRNLDDQPSLRFTSGAASGLWLGAVAGLLLSSQTVGMLLFVACVLYGLCAADAQRGRLRMFLLSLMIAALAAAGACFLAVAVFFEADSSDLQGLMWRLAGYLGLSIGIFVAWLLAYRWAMREARYVSAKEHVD